MASAVAKLEAFSKYKKSTKRKVFSEFFELESLMGNLSLRLSENRRPAFLPPADRTVDSLGVRLQRLQQLEAVNARDEAERWGGGREEWQQRTRIGSPLWRMPV